MVAREPGSSIAEAADMLPGMAAVTAVVNEAPVASVSALASASGTASQPSSLSPDVCDNTNVTDRFPVPAKALLAKTSGAHAPGVTSTVWSSALPAPALDESGCSDSPSVIDN